MLRNYRILKFVLLSLFMLGISCGLLDALSRGWIGDLYPVPKINYIRYDPKWYCSGDRIEVEWDIENIDRIALVDKDDLVLASSNSRKSSMETPPIYLSMEPLKVKGYWEGMSDDAEVEHLYNCDNPQWTTNIYSSEELVQDGIRVAQIGEKDVFTADGTVQTVPVFGLYKTYLGFRWNLYRAGFSLRIKFNKIQNRSDHKLRFRVLETGEEITLDPPQEGELPNMQPPGTLFGYYMAPKEDLWAIRIGELTKPEKEYFDQYEVRNTKIACIRLWVICSEEPIM